MTTQKTVVSGLVILILALAAGRPAAAATFTVDSTTDAVDSDAGDGTCQTVAGECTLRAAIQQANALPGEDTIDFSCPNASCIYALEIPDTDSGEDQCLTGDLDITQDVIIAGDGRDVTIVDGNRSYRVFSILAGATVIMDGLTIQNANEQIGVGGGFAIYPGGSLDLKNSAIVYNKAAIGAGIDTDGDLILENVDISHNIATSISGGGIANGGTIALISQSSITHNEALFHGAGITNVGAGTITIRETLIDMNTAGGGGGGIYNSGMINMENSTISNNISTSESVGGGGIFNENEFNLTNVTISGNTSTFDGGGISNANPSAGILTNVTLTGNTSQNGRGGGLSYFSGPFKLKNTIIAGNAGRLGPDCYTLNPVESLGYNLIYDTTNCSFMGEAGTDITGTDPSLDPVLDSNGDPFTLTHSLLDGSVAIDGGTNDGCPATDQRGFSRLATVGDPCDIGAFEVGCGDGILQGSHGEQCDDGNQDDTDSCLNSCVSATCGDSVVLSGVEECDDGGNNDDALADACRTNCANARCGDGVKDSAEACDDGNQDNADACFNTCVSATCGDGVVQADVEGCDDAAANSDKDADACRTNCTNARCGDGIKDSAEGCDDGNQDNSDSCLNTCQPPSCGDGFTQTSVEECDDGNTLDGDGCSALCVTQVGNSQDNASPNAPVDDPDESTDTSTPASGSSGCSLISIDDPQTDTTLPIMMISVFFVGIIIIAMRRLKRSVIIAQAVWQSTSEILAARRHHMLASAAPMQPCRR